MTASCLIGYFPCFEPFFIYAMAKTASTPKNFESAVTELENIVQEMENGNLPLEQALDRYQRGTELLKYCQETLQAAEQRVSQLDNGRLTPFQNTADRDGNGE